MTQERETTQKEKLILSKSKPSPKKKQEKLKFQKKNYSQLFGQLV